MSEKLLNILISAAAGVAGAFGVLYWKGLPAVPPAEPPAAQQTRTGQFDELDVARLRVTEGVWVCHSETGQPLIELKDGVILAKNEVLARYVGGLEMVGRKLQITTGDPSAEDPPIYCELGASDGGQGAYIALLSPRGTHSVNVGFDRNETGFVVSRNNDDASMTAQAVLPVPRRDEAAAPDAEPAASGDAPEPEEPRAASAQPADPEPAPAESPRADPPRVALTPAPAPSVPAENRVPGGLPMLSPVKPQ